MDIMTNPGFAKLYKQAFPELGESISETLPAVSKSVGKSNFYKVVKIGVIGLIAGTLFYAGYKLFEKLDQGNNKN